MQISIQWLREAWLDSSWSTQRLAESLTMGGIEVEAIDRAASPLPGVVVAAVRTVRSHPQAEKLRIAEVDAGDGRLRQVVCGAANLRPGQCVPLALPGALLPGDVHIQETELRGVRSEGMLCSAAELNLADGSSGLLELDAQAPLGHALYDYLRLDDEILTLGITPNRGDAFSYLGIARDLSALGAGMLRAWQPQAVSWAQQAQRAPLGERLQIAVEPAAAQACPRYHALLLEDLPTRLPDHLRERLRRSGQRQVAPVVDWLNLQMLALGQPMHAFDADQIRGGLTVRWARSGEILDALDGRDRILESDMLVIADDEGPVALAGIIGGRRTAVHDDTRRIVLESAYFQAKAVQGRARRLGLQTEAAMRFERGVDFRLGLPAAVATWQSMAHHARVTVLASAMVANAEPDLPWIPLRSQRVARILGFAPPAERIREILSALGCSVEAQGEGSWRVQPPSHRYDLRIEADLIEEIARISGYDQLPQRQPLGLLAPHPLAPEPRAEALRAFLVARDYHEVITYSFISAEAQARFCPDDEPVALRNPLSNDLAVLRGSLWPGLLQALQFNVNRQQERVRLFEMGRIFTGAQQRLQLAGVIHGPALPEHWSGPSPWCDFYDLRGDVEGLLRHWQTLDLEYRRSCNPNLHPGQSADLWLDGSLLGSIGALRPNLHERYELDKAAFLFYLDLEALAKHGKSVHFQPIPSQPGLRRDLALIVPEGISAGQVLRTVREAASRAVREHWIFDRYQGSQVAPGHYGLGVGLLLQEDDRTLTESEVQGELERILAALRTLGSIQLRIQG
ncbi:phenylalanine--tRNA ligase subunit beta [Acidithiobacillus caldus]|jgi:phenylalanyl-tRNA synthetase beta chain|uniref:Phenylalanine--tRNA ligase beta subunit n=4 Tax=Acidithiobacillus caldus TaxID=33059 RepID=A0A059ZXU4_ACICK|nr:phenylalanine--tRNA ligase subunit beta [Acidithiobacillus caldus]AIA56248.1 Phenylalanyl-tRNA synthetase beta chain [Acidithiobacillus caldus ATCC 51756]MBU2729932.1 phenylalanine--tRNA ligase subunit beta [Acidithiobacillus caldus]MBU2735283.1 phenylalanine--tRNA ligase subunit beta [Acidithiobacillus caldus ATCC 51756]MBU2744880.1 phenylalanine--tRNA ligase subunit beta [Acidithiobacillus caldus]MBU2762606.1 phenylalanine--tRNA ligase subunit beta [Acidithiobacillus caldus]